MAQRQFRSDDTAKWVYGFGGGSDGVYSSAGNATDAPIDSACTGTADSTSLSATNVNFAPGQLILIHQTRGTANVGKWELNRIASYTAGTITLSHALINTYAALSQVQVLKQYSSFTQNSGHTLTAKAWDGTVGGIMGFLCNGTTTITGTLTATGKGYAGGAGQTGDHLTGKQGEGTAGAGGTQSVSANGNGGGGGGQSAGSGAGGGNGAAGTNGSVAGSTAQGGSAVGNAGLTICNFGGGGGSASVGSGGGVSGAGGIGGGLIFIFTKNLAQITGNVYANGNNGAAYVSGDSQGAGGGAGGSILIKAQTAILGTTKITASGGAGGSAGGAGAAGRIHLDYLTSTSGTTTPTLDATQDLTLLQPGSGSLFFAQY